MSETGFTEDGFYRRTQQQIYDDYKIAASGVYEEFNLGPGSTNFQLAKIIGIREREMEILFEAMVSGLSIETAYGDFLEKFAIDKGLERKGPQKAGGYINLTFNAPGSGDTPVNLKNTYYTTPDGKKYYRAVTGVSQYVRHYVTITRSTKQYDGLPPPFNSIAGTGYVNSNRDGLGTDYDPVFNTETQVFDWANATSYPATGNIYYVGISGYEINVKDDISADIAGTGYNIGINNITKWHNNITLPADATVNNPFDITGGSDWEEDEYLRARIKSAIDRSFTYNKLTSICNGIIGVRAVQVYQDVGADKYSITGDYDTEKVNYQGGVMISGIYSGADRDDMVSGNMYSQAFWIGDGIMGMKQVNFYGRRIGNPPSMIIGLRKAVGEDYEASGIFDTYDTSPPSSNWQDLIVPLKYLDLDPGTEYRLDFWCAEKSGASGTTFWNANYWEIATGDVISGNLGNGDNYTGLFTLGESAIDTGINSIFKTYYPAAAITIDVAVEDGYNYTEIEAEIDDKLDWEEGQGYMPIGVEYTIQQATPIQISYSVTLYLEEDAVLQETKDRIDVSVENYI